MCKLRPIRSSSSPSAIAWSAKNIQESSSTRSFSTAKTWASKGMHQSTCTLWALVLRLSFWPFLNQVPKSHMQSVFQPHTALVQSLTTTCSKTSLSPFLFLFETMEIHETSWFLFVSEPSITAGLGFWLYLVYWSDQYYSISSSSSACSFALRAAKSQDCSDNSDKNDDACIYSDVFQPFEVFDSCGHVAVQIFPHGQRHPECSARHERHHPAQGTALLQLVRSSVVCSCTMVVNVWSSSKHSCNLHKHPSTGP